MLFSTEKQWCSLTEGDEVVFSLASRATVPPYIEVEKLGKDRDGQLNILLTEAYLELTNYSPKYASLSPTS